MDLNTIQTELANLNKTNGGYRPGSPTDGTEEIASFLLKKREMIFQKFILSILYLRDGFFTDDKVGVCIQVTLAETA